VLPPAKMAAAGMVSNLWQNLDKLLETNPEEYDRLVSEWAEESHREMPEVHACIELKEVVRGKQIVVHGIAIAVRRPTGPSCSSTCCPGHACLPRATLAAPTPCPSVAERSTRPSARPLWPSTPPMPRSSATGTPWTSSAPFSSIATRAGNSFAAGGDRIEPASASETLGKCNALFWRAGRRRPDLPRTTSRGPW